MITVYIPTRGRSKLVRRAVLSVLKQSYSDLEVIVVIDGKDKETESVLQQLSSQDSRVKCYSYDEPQGACYARNLAISLASGEFITGLDDDDYFDTNHLKNNLNFLMESKSEVSFSLQRIWDGNKFSSANLSKGFRVGIDDILRGNVIGNQVFCRTKSLRLIGGFDPQLPALQDYETWIRMIKNFDFALCSGETTYVVDTSHSHERITKSPSKIRAAIKYIEFKHKDLYKNKMHLLYGTFFRYKGTYPRFIELLPFISIHGCLTLVRVLFSRLNKKINL